MHLGHSHILLYFRALWTDFECKRVCEGTVMRPLRCAWTFILI